MPRSYPAEFRRKVNLTSALISAAERAGAIDSMSAIRAAGKEPTHACGP